MNVRYDMVTIVISVAITSATLMQKGQAGNENLAFTLQIITDVVVFFSVSLRMFGEIDN